jgi:hypothetical protein
MMLPLLLRSDAGTKAGHRDGVSVFSDPDAVAPLSASVAGGNRQAITDQHLAYLRQAYDIVINQELIAQRF